MAAVAAGVSKRAGRRFNCSARLRRICGRASCWVAVGQLVARQRRASWCEPLVPAEVPAEHRTAEYTVGRSNARAPDARAERFWAFLPSVRRLGGAACTARQSAGTVYTVQ